MKKTYITPSMEVIKIASQTQMLAGSLTKSNETITSETDVLGRGFNDNWEDEDF